ncbi:MAG: hypothetical protein ACKOB2_04120 [Solirubrobacterales bacterium]
MPSRFPPVEGRSLDDEEVLLPSGLEGDRNLLAVAFHRTQQREVDTWIPLFRELEARFPGLAGYEIPTISGNWRPLRRFIDGGMKAAIPDPLTRRRTVTVYGDVGKVTDGLGLPNRNRIAVLLCDREGEVGWMARGPLEGEPPEGLLEALGAVS